MMNLAVAQTVAGPCPAAEVVDPVLPTSRELQAAMDGDVPPEHSAAPILQAAFLLAHLDTWIDPDAVRTSTGDTGSTVLWELGAFDISHIVRARLVDDINRTARTAQVGPAVDTVARPWSEHRRASSHRNTSRLDDVLHRRAVGALINARVHYTRVRRTQTLGFDPKSQ